MLTAREQETADVSKLHDLLDESISFVSEATHLAREDIVDLLEHMHVERVADLKPTIMEMSQFGGIAEPLSDGIAGMIHNLAEATDLDTDEITSVFCEKCDAGLDDVVSRLREKSRSNRWNLAAV